MCRRHKTCAGLFESAQRAGRAESESSFYENSSKRQKLLQSLRSAQRQLPRGGSLIYGGAFRQLDCLHRSALLPPCARSCAEGTFSLRVNHGAALGPIQGPIHYRAAASLPSGREPDVRWRFVTARLFAQKRSPSTAYAVLHRRRLPPASQSLRGSRAHSGSDSAPRRRFAAHLRGPF